jgi:hypothetical protein
MIIVLVLITKYVIKELVVHLKIVQMVAHVVVQVYVDNHRVNVMIDIVDQVYSGLETVVLLVVALTMMYAMDLRV